MKEILTCGDDPIYFIEKYCKITHQVKGLIGFDLFEYQKQAIRLMASSDRLIVNKARQLGFTTVTAAFIVWLILFHKNKEVLVVSIDAEVAKGLLEKVKLMLVNIPEWMYLADITTNRAHKVVLSNGSSVTSIARSDNAGRSKAVALLVIDEAALIRNMGEMWKGLKSTVSTGGKIIALSTPKGTAGTGGWFYRTWVESKSGENGWNNMLVNWWECSEYNKDLEDDQTVPGGKTSTWFREFTKDMTRMQIAQELLTSFIDTSDTYFDSETLQYWNKVVRDPIAKEQSDKTLWVWKLPVAGHKYLIPADSSTGSGEDYSAFHVIDLSTMEVVAEYKGKVYPDIFGEIILRTAERYNMAWVAPENIHIGAVTCFYLKSQGYRNLVYLTKEFKLVDQWTAEYQGILPGVPNDVRNRSSMVAKIEEYLRKKTVTIFSQRLLNEMHTFATINGKAQAAKHANDDLIMSLAIGLWLRDMIKEFSIGYDPSQVGNSFIAPIVISKSQYSHSIMSQDMKMAQLKRQLEQSGYYSVNGRSSHLYLNPNNVQVSQPTAPPKQLVGRKL
jgi:hypothetical protein